MTADFGRYLRATREAKGLTRQEVSERSRLSYAYLSQLESGKKSAPSPRALHQLARGLGVSVEELAARSGVQVDIVGAPLAAAADEQSLAAVSDDLVWHDNPAWSSPAGTDAERTSVSAGAGHSELAQARAEVLPALRRLMAGYSPTTRVALLAELQSGAVADLTADQ
jgi:transcriptional regulator with XRE-family HTH domain